MVATGLVGVPIGTWLLAYLNPTAFRLCMGALLLTYSTCMLLGRSRQVQIAWGGRGTDGAIGLAGGILGGLAGLSGPLPTIWATLRGWSKDERRAVFQVYNLAVLLWTVVLHAASGRLTAEVFQLAFLALPGTIAGACSGRALTGG